MKLNVGYNFQGNNYSFGGKFSAWIQCMTTSAWMLMSYFSDEIQAEDDKGLASYLDNVEASVGSPGLAEKLLKKFSWITGRTSQWWLIQQAGIEELLWRHGVKGRAVFCNKDKTGMTYDVLPKILEKSPVMIGTKKIGGLPGGHIILAIGFSEEGIICNDPAGSAMTNYNSQNGGGVVYPVKYLKKFTGDSFYAIYWEAV